MSGAAPYPEGHPFLARPAHSADGATLIVG